MNYDELDDGFIGNAKQRAKFLNNVLSKNIENAERDFDNGILQTEEARDDMTGMNVLWRKAINNIARSFIEGDGTE